MCVCECARADARKQNIHSWKITVKYKMRQVAPKIWYLLRNDTASYSAFFILTAMNRETTKQHFSISHWCRHGYNRSSILPAKTSYKRLVCAYCMVKYCDPHMFTAQCMQSNVFWAVCNARKLGESDTARDVTFAVTRPPWTSDYMISHTQTLH